ncbi:hypothetical protein Glove_551g50 [Diversispora epigaea]|uniref:Uncharacterized protein n=1 Tax=Diversispora epigaea TaxID=1348612 RepID=A0A397GBN4_9GLOM|nr:hypothetical protein Glove_551g50 [Diversispora epigaea]
MPYPFQTFGAYSFRDNELTLGELIRDIIKMDDGKQILVEIIDPGEIPNRNNEVFGFNEDLNTDEHEIEQQRSS